MWILTMFFLLFNRAYFDDVIVRLRRGWAVQRVWRDVSRGATRSSLFFFVAFIFVGRGFTATVTSSHTPSPLCFSPLVQEEEEEDSWIDLNLLSRCYFSCDELPTRQMDFFTYTFMTSWLTGRGGGWSVVPGAVTSSRCATRTSALLAQIPSPC